MNRKINTYVSIIMNREEFEYSVGLGSLKCIPALIAGFLLLLNQVPALAQTDAPVISRLQVLGSGESAVTYLADSEQNYYVLKSGTNIHELLIAEGAQFGVIGSNFFTAIEFPDEGNVKFFAVDQIPLNAPLDLDQDGIDDVYELRRSNFFDPLDGSDALQDFDGDGRVNLEELFWKSDPLVSNQFASIQLIAPTNGQAFSPGEDILLRAIADDPDGEIWLVNFLADDRLIGGEVTNPYHIVWHDPPPGTHVLRAAAMDSFGGISYSAPVTIYVDALSAPTLQASKQLTDDQDVLITGTVEPNTMLELAGGATSINYLVPADGSVQFRAPLKGNRLNRLFATLHRDGIQSPVQTLNVTQDSQAPSLHIDFPENGEHLIVDEIVVAGRVADTLSGFMGLQVNVNGFPAEVDVGVGQNGTFEVAGLPLQMGRNLIRATATDMHGNEQEAAIEVIREPADGIVMEVIAGNLQSAPVYSWLPVPATVKITNRDGNPLAKKPVTFEILRSNGQLAGSPNSESAGCLYQTLTDDNGLAQVFWRLGGDAGCGNNRLRVSSRDVSGIMYFCASAGPGPATQINIGSGNRQMLEISSPAMLPLRTWVSDACNGISGLPVTYSVVRGGGSVNGQSSVTLDTGITGHSEVDFIAGPVRGSQIVEADFPGNPFGPAVFRLDALDRDPAGTMTIFEGLVQDNAGQAVGGARCILEVQGTNVVGLTGVDGRFRLENPPAGPGHLHVEGLVATSLNGTAISPGTFPNLAYEVLVVDRSLNAMPTPVLLPALNPNNARTYDGSTDLELTIEGMPGLKMTIAAGSMLLKDGTRPSPANPAVVALNQVHHDDIPMPIPDGASPPFAWTLQPAGAHFNPPVKIEYPNMSGLEPMAIAYFLSYDHDTESFNIVASGSVTEDGSTIVTDPGVGLPVAGWGCNCPPYSVTGACEDDCQNNPDPCCGSNDPCCGSDDPCCGSDDPCCGNDDPCCGREDEICCDPDDPCCNPDDPCCDARVVDVILTPQPWACCVKRGDPITPSLFDIQVITDPPDCPLGCSFSFDPPRAETGISILSRDIDVRVTATCGDEVIEKTVTVHAINEDRTGSIEFDLGWTSGGLLDKIDNAIDGISSDPRQTATSTTTPLETDKGLTIETGILCCPNQDDCRGRKVKVTGSLSSSLGSIRKDFPFAGIPYVASANVRVFASGKMELAVSGETTCDLPKICGSANVSASIGGGLSATLFNGSVADASLTLRANVTGKHPLNVCFDADVITAKGGALCFNIKAVGEVKLFSLVSVSVEASLLDDVCTGDLIDTTLPTPRLF